MAAARRPDRDPTRPVYVISVAASIVSAHPRTLRIYEDEGLVCPARTPTNIRLYSKRTSGGSCGSATSPGTAASTSPGSGPCSSSRSAWASGSWSACTTEGTREQAAERPATTGARRRQRAAGPAPSDVGASVTSEPHPPTPAAATAPPTRTPAPKETTDGQANVEPGRPSRTTATAESASSRSSRSGRRSSSRR